MKKLKDKVYKTIETEIKEIDKDRRVIWHKISREVPDRMGDVVRLTGLSLDNFRKKPGVLYGHSYAGIDPVPVIGENIGFKLEGDTLYAGTRFFDPEVDRLSPKLTDLVNDLWFLHSNKLMGWSIGFIPNKWEYLEDENENITGYDFQESELLEYSSVIIPCHQDAIDNALQEGRISKGFQESLKDLKKEAKEDQAREETEIKEDAGEIGEIGEIGEEPGQNKEQPEEREAEADQVEESQEQEKSEENKQGIPPELIEKFGEAIDSLIAKRKKLREYLEKTTGGKVG